VLDGDGLRGCTLRLYWRWRWLRLRLWLWLWWLVAGDDACSCDNGAINISDTLQPQPVPHVLQTHCVLELSGWEVVTLEHGAARGGPGSVQRAGGSRHGGWSAVVSRWK
jgi:hypothetical protein